MTPDHWIYFSSGDVFFGRMHEPKNWSADMAPAGRTSLVVEMFCFENDPVWSEPDASVLQRVAQRLAELKLIEEKQVSGGCVVRLPKAYPLYVNEYRRRMHDDPRFPAPVREPPIRRPQRPVPVHQRRLVH